MQVISQYIYIFMIRSKHTHFYINSAVIYFTLHEKHFLNTSAVFIFFKYSIFQKLLHCGRECLYSNMHIIQWGLSKVFICCYRQYLLRCIKKMQWKRYQKPYGNEEQESQMQASITEHVCVQYTRHILEMLAIITHEVLEI